MDRANKLTRNQTNGLVPLLKVLDLMAPFW